ncbi:hypothetical protein HanRHA438_Chr10g0472271 [Helianthus annuus]|nr:hypothetical protein HanRHA438_Chr10g0472271 [Helianthus annuus]
MNSHKQKLQNRKVHPNFSIQSRWLISDEIRKFRWLFSSLWRGTRHSPGVLLTRVYGSSLKRRNY